MSHMMGEVMSTKSLNLRPHIVLQVSALALAAFAQSAHAQDANLEIAASELPPIVVEGATLEAKPASKPKAQPEPAAADEQQAGQAPKAKKKAAPDAGTSAATENDEPVDASQFDAANGGAGTGSSVDGTPVNKLGSAVSVVTAAELKQRQVRNAVDALRSLPGVSVSQQGGAQNLAVVRIRGGESNHTQVLIDGVEVNSSSEGFYDFSNLTVEDIAQIEVIRGPQSGLYSSGALSGVINIVTNSGKGPLTFRARAEAGSFGTRDGMVGMSGGTDRAHGSITLSGRDIHGFDISPIGTEDDGGRFSTLSFTGGIMVFDNLKLDATLRRSRRDGDRDGFDGIDANGLSIASEELSTFSSDVWLGRLEATLDTFDKTWIHKFFVRGTETDNTDHGRGFFPSDTRNISTMSEYGYLSTYRIGELNSPVRHFVTGLVEHRREQFEQPLNAAAAFERDRDSVAGEIRGEYFDTVSLTGNIRHDQNEGFDDETTWRVAGSVLTPFAPLRLHGSVGTGVKYPSFAEQYGQFFGFVPNPDLVAETSTGWDAGVEWTLLKGKAIIDVTYFHSTLENEIDSSFFIAPTPGACGGAFFCSTSVNRTGESLREGIEVSGRAMLTDGLSLGLAYTYLRAREDNGAEEIRRAPHSGRADLNYTFLDGKANLNLAAVYNGTMQDIVFQAVPPFSSFNTPLDGYWLVNVAASYKIAPGTEIYGRVENLLDEHYQEIFGYEAAGIGAYAGVRFTFEEPSTKDWEKYR